MQEINGPTTSHVVSLESGLINYAMTMKLVREHRFNAPFFVSTTVVMVFPPALTAITIRPILPRN